MKCFTIVWFHVVYDVMMMCLYLASVWGHDEERLDGVFAKESVSLMAQSWLHLVISIQTFQRCLGDMNLPVGGGANNHTLTFLLICPRYMKVRKKWHKYLNMLLNVMTDWPRQSSCLHHVGQCHIIGPDVILPLAEPQNPAEHTARVQTHTHV